MRHCLAHRTAFVVCLAFAACARPSPLTILARAPRVADGPRAVKLVEDPCSGHGEVLAPVDVSGHATWLLVDSGAFEHVLTPQLVDAAKLRVTDQTVLVGGGAGVPATILSPLTFSVPGLGTLRPARVLRLPIPDTTECGIGGVLSPAQLATDDEAVIVDVPNKRLSLGPFDKSGATFSAMRLSYVSYVTGGTLEATSTKLLVDTGSCCTWVHTETIVGKALLAKAEKIDKGPTNVFAITASHRARSVRMRVGGLERTTDVYLLPGKPQHEEGDGALGIDVLRSCVMSFAVDAMHARCTP